MATDADTLQTVYSNYCRILAMLTQVIANPTQSAIDALVAAAANAGIVQAKPTYTEDGATYNWTEYQQFILSNMALLRQQMVEAGGPFAVVTRAAY